MSYIFKISCAMLTTSLLVCLCANTALAMDKNNISVKDLDNLNSRISFLKKKVEIAELNKTLKELQSSDDSENKNTNNRITDSSRPIKPKPKPIKKSDLKKTIAKLNKEHNKKSPSKIITKNMATVLSISGVGKQLYATIKTPQSQTVRITKGDETKFGEVVDINKNRILFNKDGKEKSLYI